jgi:hypothetical protein
MPKGYKLTSASGDGPKTCAFFFSDKGCRNGDNCKFSHEKAAPTPKGAPSSAASVSSSSVVSSESESDGEIVERTAGAYASLAKNQVDIRPDAAGSGFVNPFLAAVAPPPSKIVVNQNDVQEQPPVTVKTEQATATSEKKKKKKRKKSMDATPVATDGNPFALTTSPPNQTKQGTSPVKSEDVAAPPVKKSKSSAAQKGVAGTPTQANTASPANTSFRNLHLPIASFSLPTTAASASTPKSASKSPARPSSPQHEPAPTPPPKPLPIATPAHLKWKAAVLATRASDKYENSFNYDRAQKFEYTAGISTPNDWFTTKPYGQWCAGNPTSIAIDCEMCETKEPGTGKIDSKALCRISIVNGDNPSEVLLDTLVKPEWPVSNYRTWVNGIEEKDLKDVQFTLQHAQTFMQALCSEQTVIVGHAVHNDLLALRMVHHVNVDTAHLFTHTSVEDGTPSLKNLAHGVLNREMPEVHDSVNDARVALECAEHWVGNGGKVAPVEKVFTKTRPVGRGRLENADTTLLLVHRLPPGTQPNHIAEMFLAYTQIKPKHVPEITFSGSHGKVNVEFTSEEHAELAYVTLVGEEREDKGGKKQKRVGLKGGGYVCVRKMKKGK